MPFPSKTDPQPHRAPSAVARCRPGKTDGARRPDTRRTGPRHHPARKTGRCTPPAHSKLKVYLGRVGGSVPPQTFLTNLSKEQKRLVRNNNYTPPPTQKTKSQSQDQSQSQNQSVVQEQQNARVKPVSGTEAAEGAG